MNDFSNIASNEVVYYAKPFKQPKHHIRYLHQCHSGTCKHILAVGPKKRSKLAIGLIDQLHSNTPNEFNFSYWDQKNMCISVLCPDCSPDDTKINAKKQRTKAEHDLIDLKDKVALPTKGLTSFKEMHKEEESEQRFACEHFSAEPWMWCGACKIGVCEIH